MASENSLTRGRPIPRGRRELVGIFPYAIVYRVCGDVVRVLRICAATRRRTGAKGRRPDYASANQFP